MFNINEFKSVMNKYGGPAKSNLFVVSLGVQPKTTRKTDFIDNFDLRFFCSEVSIPGLNITSASYTPNTIGIPEAMPLNLSSVGINCTFMLDSEHRVLSFFHSWMQEIINYDTINGGSLSQINGDHLPFEIGYKEDYACATLDIYHFKTNSDGTLDNSYKYTFANVFPTEVGAAQLTWSPTDSIQMLTVNFNASGFTFSASDPGTTISDLSRGNGTLELLKSVGFRGQTTQQRNLPTTVQDAINTFTTVRNDFRAIKNTFNAFRNLF
jgi:hypothetical protein